MSFSVAVHFLPSLTTPEELAAGTVVVIDVLRASTTIIHALAAGATAILPCLEVEDARKLAAASGDKTVLGGERAGLLIPGFDLSNSPTEYTSQTVSGKTLIFTTTNGTTAMRQCRLANRVLIGAFVNLSALCAALPEESPVHLLCAGTRGQITREDVLFAGAVVHKLTCLATGECDWNDEARIVRDVWNAAFPSSGTNEMPAPRELATVLRNTQGGRNLIALGLSRDIDHAAEIDKFLLVPSLDVSRWQIGV